MRKGMTMVAVVAILAMVFAAGAAWAGTVLMDGNATVNGVAETIPTAGAPSVLSTVAGTTETFDFTAGATPAGPHDLDMNDGTQRKFATANNTTALSIVGVTNIIDGGDFDTSRSATGSGIGRNGGAVSITATGNITGGNVLTYTLANDGNFAGDVTLTAGGTIVLGGYINATATRQVDNTGSVTLTGSSITINGAMAGVGGGGSYSINAGDKEFQNDNQQYVGSKSVYLYTPGAVTLAGGINVHAGESRNGGSIIIRGSVGDATSRAGAVSVTGSLNGYERTNGAVNIAQEITVRSTSTIGVTGDVLSYVLGNYNNAANISINSNGGAVTIGGIVDAHLQGNGGGGGGPYGGGTINIEGTSVAIQIANTNGVSVLSYGHGSGSIGRSITLTASAGNLSVAGGLDAHGNTTATNSFALLNATGSISLGGLNVNLMSYTAFNVDSDNAGGEKGAISGAVLNFATGTPTNGALRVDSGKAITYDPFNSSNIYLGFGTYTLNQVDNSAGTGQLTPYMTSHVWAGDSGPLAWDSTQFDDATANGATAATDTAAFTAGTGQYTVTVDDGGGSPTVGHIALTGANAYTIQPDGTNGGTITLDNGAGNSNILADGAASHTISADIALNSNLVVNTNTASQVLEVSGDVSGAAKNVTKSGAGTLALSGTNSYGGDTTISGGALRGTFGTGLPNTGKLKTDGGVWELNAGFTDTLGDAAGKLNLSGAAGGGFSAYGGSDVTVDIGGAGATQTWASGQFVANGAALLFGSSTADAKLIFANEINLNAANRTISVTDNAGSAGDMAEISGRLTGTGSSAITKTGTGILILSNTGNNYASSTTVNGGTLQLGASGVIPDTSDLVVTSGTFDVNGMTETVAKLSGAAAGTIALNGGTLTVNETSDLTYAGVITGASGSTLVKNGNNKLVLSGTSSSFAGTIQVNAGTLSVERSNDGIAYGAGGSSANIIVAAGKSLRVGGGGHNYGELPTTVELQGATITNFGWYSNYVQAYTGLITLAPSTTSYVDLGNNPRNTIVLAGGITGTGALEVKGSISGGTTSGDCTPAIKGSNDYSGGTTIGTSTGTNTYLVLDSTSSLGTGAVYINETKGILLIVNGVTYTGTNNGAITWASTAANITMENDIYGKGTVKSNGAGTVTVKRNALNTAGSLNPGLSIGILTADANLSFARNASNQAAQLVIEVDDVNLGNGWTAGEDYDQLVVASSRTVSNLGNLFLVIDLGDLPEGTFAPTDTLTVISSPGTDFSVMALGGYMFTSDLGITWVGMPHYNNGSVTFDNLHVMVPEPAALFSLGGIALLALKRRRS